MWCIVEPWDTFDGCRDGREKRRHSVGHHALSVLLLFSLVDRTGSGPVFARTSLLCGAHVHRGEWPVWCGANVDLG